MEIIEKAHAKINICLNVINKRLDNYHNLETIMTSIDLMDYLMIKERSDQQIVIETDNSFLPLDDNNHIYKAVNLLRKTANLDNGVTIQLIKKIPVSAGLAGGSSDAAATLRGLNKLWNLNYSLSELAKIGSKIGIDVPYCVFGGTKKATGIGTELTILPNLRSCWMILVKPNISISTSKIFQVLDISNIKHPNISMVENAIKSQNYIQMCHNMGNSLESETMKYCPQIKSIKQCLLKLGADGVVMSGTGPTMVGFCNNHRKALKIMNGIKGFCDEVYLARTI